MLGRPAPLARGVPLAEDRVGTTIDEELLEFLASDWLPEAADPAFKAKLREELRAMLREQGTLRPPPSRDDD
jgi:hypothetical protein